MTDTHSRRLKIDRQVVMKVIADRVRNAPSIMDPEVHDGRAVRRGIALSGGGSHGDFEVGALQYLWQSVFADVPPHIIGGTSVGSVNGALAAEGDVESIERLVKLWNESGLYAPQDVQRALAPLGELGGDLLGVGIASIVLGPIAFLFGAPIALGKHGDIDGKLYRALSELRELYSLDPVRSQAHTREMTWSATGPGLRSGGCSIAPLPTGELVVVARAVDRSLHAKVLGQPRWHALSIVAAEDPKVTVGPRGTPWLLVRDVAGGIFCGAISLIDGRPNLSLDELSRDAPVGERGRPWTAPWGSGGAIGFEPTSQTLYAAATTEPGVLWQRANQARYGRWDPWTTHTPLQQAIGGDLFVGNLALAFAVNGTGMMAARRPNGDLVTAHRAGNGGIGGAFTPFSGPRATSHPTLVASGDAIHLFYRGANNAAIHAVARRDRWSAPQDLGGVLLSEVAACATPGGGVAAFVLGTDHAIWCNESSAADAPFAGWHSLGKGDPIGFTGQPVVSVDAAGTIHLFAVGDDRALHHRARPRGGAWGTWESLGGRCMSGPRLRMAMVSLENGDTRHMDEYGVVRGRAGFSPPWSRTDGIIASSSIAVINRPVRILDETYIDGGFASATPIASVLAECDEVYAIIASSKSMESADDAVVARHPDIVAALGGALTPQPGVREVISEEAIADVIADQNIPFLSPMGQPARRVDFADASILDVGLRALSQIFPRSVLELELEPPTGWPKPVTVIRPTMTLHPSDVMEWTTMSIEYGFMRAYDVLHAPDRARAMASSDKITMARLWCAKCEQLLVQDNLRYTTQREAAPSRGDRTRWQGRPFASRAPELMRAIRALKQLVKSAVETRRAAGDALPSSAGRWAVEWEVRGIPTTVHGEMVLRNPDPRVPVVTVPAA